jgi:hypothetical protein
VPLVPTSAAISATMSQLATSAVPRLDVFMLHRSGALTTGAVTRWQWPLPTSTITVTARAEGHRLFLSLNGGPEIAYAVIYRPGTTGSSYPFLECTCERSARYLYIHENRIACRICHDLTWPSWQPGQWNTSLRQVDRLRAKLAAAEMQAIKQQQRSAKRLKFVIKASL